MKKLFAILMTVCMLAGMCTVSTFAANDAVVYLKAGGTGDGSSEANAAGTLPDAMAAAVACSCNNSKKAEACCEETATECCDTTKCSECTKHCCDSTATCDTAACCK